MKPSLKQSENKSVTYKDLSKSVIYRGALNTINNNKVASNQTLNVKESYRFDNGLYLGTALDTMKKKFKQTAPTYGNWEKFMLNTLRQEKSSTSIL